ncbi:hypothetical protein PCAR4_150084 [Paraburkholderia caribensis]|nr:hypothetical protein PCAR4_150084 [Paraburkholderia caribensis]
MFDRTLWITHFACRFGGRISPYFPKISHAAPARLTRKPLWHKRLGLFRLAASGLVAYPAIRAPAGRVATITTAT